MYDQMYVAPQEHVNQYTQNEAIISGMQTFRLDNTSGFDMQGFLKSLVRRFHGFLNEAPRLAALSKHIQ